MTKYEMILESLQERVDSGELTMEDAEVLNQAAYDKYGEMEVTESEDDDTSVTLEEAMDIISSYIEEKACSKKETCPTCGKAPCTCSKEKKVAKKILTDSNSTIKVDKGLPKKTSVTESVDVARLNVYEAFEAGHITEDEKDTFLEYLNLENYE